MEDDEDEIDFLVPKNSICAAHSLQLVLKDVFKNNEDLKELVKVSLYEYCYMND